MEGQNLLKCTDQLKMEAWASVLYHYACLRHIAQWALPPERAPPWRGMEATLFSPLNPIHALSTKLTNDIKSHPIIVSLFYVWKRISSFFAINIHLNNEACMWNNPKLKTAKYSFIWKNWLVCGIIKLADLYERNVLKSFEKITNEFNLQKVHFWKYVHLRNLLIQVFGKDSPL